MQYWTRALSDHRKAKIADCIIRLVSLGSRISELNGFFINLGNKDDLCTEKNGRSIMMESLHFKRYHHALEDKGVLLAIYDIVRNNLKSLRGDGYLADEESEDGYTWDYMIFDELNVPWKVMDLEITNIIEFEKARQWKVM
ncbi:uncharacterized protein [Euphorbia lathyris]|uniref:uncharacterized protein isoform X1 n=1 Tax=Euphorbia lathyris TaxID=212925 RepID=UPI003313FDC2